MSEEQHNEETEVEAHTGPKTSDVHKFSANNEPVPNASTPGVDTRSTPRKPTISAPQHTGPTTSLSRRIAAMVAKSGAEKLMATALASGIRLKAMTRKACEQDCETPRTR